MRLIADVIAEIFNLKAAAFEILSSVDVAENVETIISGHHLSFCRVNVNIHQRFQTGPYLTRTVSFSTSSEFKRYSLNTSILNVFTSYESTYEPRHDKTNKVAVRPVKTQISLGICPV